MGVAQINKTYYPNGKIESEYYFDENNKPAYSFGVHLFQYEYDNKNRLTSFMVMNEKKQPTIHTQNNCYKMEYVYDDFNRVVEIRKYDVSNKLIKGPYPAIFTMQYREDHQIVKYESLDNNRKLCNNPDAGNIAVAKMEYDELGRKIYEIYYNKNNEVAVNTQLGYAESEMKYNKNSRVLYFKDELGKLTNVQGTCRILEIYSETSMPLFGRTDRVNIDNELEFIQRGAWEYDQYGNVLFNYTQENWGRIQITTLEGSRTIYDFDDEYDEISSKIDALQDSLVEVTFDKLEGY